MSFSIEGVRLWVLARAVFLFFMRFAMKKVSYKAPGPPVAALWRLVTFLDTFWHPWCLWPPQRSPWCPVDSFGCTLCQDQNSAVEWSKFQKFCETSSFSWQLFVALPPFPKKERGGGVRGTLLFQMQWNNHSPCNTAILNSEISD